MYCLCGWPYASAIVFSVVWVGLYMDPRHLVHSGMDYLQVLFVCSLWSLVVQIVMAVLFGKSMLRRVVYFDEKPRLLASFRYRVFFSRKSPLYSFLFAILSGLCVFGLSLFIGTSLPAYGARLWGLLCFRSYEDLGCVMGLPLSSFFQSGTAAWWQAPFVTAGWCSLAVIYFQVQSGMQSRKLREILVKGVAAE